MDELHSTIGFRRCFPAIFAWTPLLIVCLIFAIGNLTIPKIFWRSARELTGILVMFLNGVAASEIAIIASWFALRISPLQVRVLVCSLLLGLETACFVGGFKLCDKDLQTHVAVIILGIGVFGFLSLCLPLAIFRWRTGWRLVCKFDPASSEKKSQFSIGFLLGTTAAVAIMYTAIKAIWPNSTSSWPPIWQLLMSFLVFAIYSVCLFAPSFAIGLSSENRPLALLLVIIELVFIAPVSMLVLAGIFPGQWDLESVLYFYSFSVGFISSVAATAMWFRFHGFYFENAILLAEGQKHREGDPMHVDTLSPIDKSR